MNPSFIKELSRLLLEEHSRSQRDLIIDFIGTDKKKLEAAIHVFCHHPYREVQRLSWVLSGLSEKNPGLIIPHLPVLMKRLKSQPLPDAVKRNVIRILSLIEIPEALHGEAIDTTFGYLNKPDEAIAVRAFSMSILYRLSILYPEIRNELKEALELELEKNPSPGIKSKAQKILTQLRKSQKG